VELTPHLDVVERQINLMKDLVAHEEYARCFQVAADYTRFYVIANDPDTIFFAELCQNIFGEMRELIRRYKLPDEQLEKMRLQLQKSLDSIFAALKSDNNDDKYTAMRDLRVWLTLTQFNTWHMFNPRPVPSFPSPSQ
jgi:hypothetical protein